MWIRFLWRICPMEKYLAKGKKLYAAFIDVVRLHGIERKLLDGVKSNKCKCKSGWRGEEKFWYKCACEVVLCDVIVPF